MKNAILPLLTKALNAYLALDPESKHRLKELKGHTVTIELLPFHFEFQCVFTAHGVELHTEENLAAETILRGTPLQLAGAMLCKENRQQFFADDVVIEGNAEIGMQVVDLFDSLHIDWEDYFAQVAGDVPAYHVSRFLRGVKNWLKQADDSFSENVSEYVREEAEWVPSREALQDFFHDIDTVRMDVDRMDARIQQLRTRLTEEETDQ